MQGVDWEESLRPVLLPHGTADTCALVSNATQFNGALEEAGSQVSRQETVRGGHGVRFCMPPDSACVLEKALALSKYPTSSKHGPGSQYWLSSQPAAQL